MDSYSLSRFRSEASHWKVQVEPEFLQSLGCGCLSKLGEATQPKCVQCGHSGERNRQGFQDPKFLFKAPMCTV